MDKKTITFLVVAIIIFVIAFAFFIFSNIYTSSNNEVANSNINNNIQNDETLENTVPNGEEVSETKNLDVNYTDFTAYSKEDEEVKLSDFKNQAVMVLFWNTENADSVEMLKRVNEIYSEYEEKIKVLAINTKNETDTEILNQVTVPVYYDKNGEIVNEFNITEFPAMIYINAQNEVFNAKTGLTTKDALRANFDILAENF